MNEFDRSQNFKIGLDMRMAGEGYGIGRYASELLRSLLSRGAFAYVIFADKKNAEYVRSIASRFKHRFVVVDAPYYSWKEQISFSRNLDKEKLNLVHFPNFNVPLLYKKKFVVTIHDLIHHHFPGKKKRNFLHRIAYRAVIKNAVWSSKHIIAISETTRDDIIKLLHAPSKKIQVVYEGIQNKQRDLERVGGNFLTQNHITQPYILAVGVWRRYKNLPFLAKVFSGLVEKEKIPHKLILAGEEDKNYPEIKEKIQTFNTLNKIIMPGKVSDQELAELYASADCFVSASLHEGFGLPALEAQSYGVPVIASDIPSAREVLKDSVVFFDPKDELSLEEALLDVIKNVEKRGTLVKKGTSNSERYTWEECAKKTETVYKDLLKNKV